MFVTSHALLVSETSDTTQLKYLYTNSTARYNFLITSSILIPLLWVISHVLSQQLAALPQGPGFTFQNTEDGETNREHKGCCKDKDLVCITITPCKLCVKKPEFVTEKGRWNMEDYLEEVAIEKEAV